MHQVMGTIAPPSTRSASTPSSKSFIASRAAFLHQKQAIQSRRGALQVQNALTRQAKEEQLAKLETLLHESKVVVGLRYQGLTVKQMQQFRRSLPEDSTLLVVKNTLVRRAAENVEGWSNLSTAAKGDNAWLFSTEESISSSFKAWAKFQKSLKDAAPKDERDSITLLNVTGGVMDGQALGPADISRLENLPTKHELITKVAVLFKAVPTKFARSLKAVPQKFAYGLKAMERNAEDVEDKSSLVGDVCMSKDA